MTNIILVDVGVRCASLLDPAIKQFLAEKVVDPGETIADVRKIGSTTCDFHLSDLGRGPRGRDGPSTKNYLTGTTMAARWVESPDKSASE